jgi:hypothetical protein
MDLGINARGHTFEGVQRFTNRRGRLIRLLASNAEHVLDWFHIWRSHAAPQELDARHQERQRGLISEVNKKTRLGNAPQHTRTAFARATVILPRFRTRPTATSNSRRLRALGPPAREPVNFVGNATPGREIIHFLGVLGRTPLRYARHIRRRSS